MCGRIAGFWTWRSAMTTIFTPQQIKRLRREATALKKASDISHHEALDQIARREGLANWSLLMHASSPIGHPEVVPAPIERSFMYGELRDVCTRFVQDLDDDTVFLLCWSGSLWISEKALRTGKVTTLNLHALGLCWDNITRQYAFDLGALCLVDFDGLADRFVLDTDEDDEGNPLEPGPAQVLYTAKTGRHELLECIHHGLDVELDRLLMEIDAIDAGE